MKMAAAGGATGVLDLLGKGTRWMGVLLIAAFPSVASAMQRDAEYLMRALARRKGSFQIMNKTTGALLCLCLLATPLAESNAQQRVAVKIRNSSVQSIYISVYDHICRIVVFQHHLGNLGTNVVRVCLDQRGRGKITVSDRLGWNETFEVSTRRTSVSLRYPRQGR